MHQMHPVELVENPCGLFRQFFAVCCAHNLFAAGEQIPHLQTEKYFCPRTRRGQKCLELYFLLTQKTLRGFFDSLRVPPEKAALFYACQNHTFGG